MAVLGVAVKPDSNDICDSPALDVAFSIQRASAAVRVFGPEAMGNAVQARPTVAQASSAREACRDADVVLHLTEWAQFRDIRSDDLRGVVASPKIVDGRNVLDPEEWRTVRWTFRALGRP